MKELKKGDFTGIYSSIDGKPLYFTGVYSCMEYDGMPCVFLATDLHNNLTFCRWSQQDLNKRGFTIPPRPVEISKTAMQMIQKAGAVIRWTTAEERRLANTDHKRKSPYILTAANGGQWYTTGTCADVREVLKAAADEATTRPQDGPTAPATIPAGETTTRSEKAPKEATSEATTTSFYYIVTNNNGETVAAGEVAAPIEEITATATREAAAAATRYTANTGLPARYTCGGSKTPIAAAALEYIKRTTAAQEAPTRPETVIDEETPTDANKARQEASQDATPATAAGAAESTPGAPTTAGTIAADTRTAGATKAAPQGQERATAAGGIAARTKNASKAGHACEIAPGRTERAQAGQATTTPHKRPPRGKTKAGTLPPAAAAIRKKVTFSGQMQKMDQIHRKFRSTPFLLRFFRKVDQEIFKVIYEP